MKLLVAEPHVKFYYTGTPLILSTSVHEFFGRQQPDLTVNIMGPNGTCHYIFKA